LIIVLGYFFQQKLGYCGHARELKCIFFKRNKPFQFMSIEVCFDKVPDDGCGGCALRRRRQEPGKVGGHEVRHLLQSRAWDRFDSSYRGKLLSYFFLKTDFISFSHLTSAIS
jgi:hypothetical protein